MDIQELQAEAGELKRVIEPRLDRLQAIAIGMAIVGLLACAGEWLLDGPGAPRVLWPAALFGYMFWLGATTGSLALLMVHHAVGGGWGFILRRFLEAAVRLLPVMLLVYGTIFFLSGETLYVWKRPEEMATLARAKQDYLNLYFFIGRTVAYFLIWSAFAFYLTRLGDEQDRTDDPVLADRLATRSAGGLLVYAITISFAAVDWVMTLTPDWYSSIWGLLTIVSQALTTMALMLALVGFLGGGRQLVAEGRTETAAADGPIERIMGHRRMNRYFRDLGNLTLTFVMLWAYMSFSQYLITYSGNTAEEVTWYVDRNQGYWNWISASLIAFHFGLPFLILLIASGIKKDPWRLMKLACFILFMRLVDIWWWITPTFRDHLSVRLGDFGPLLLIGGIWLLLWVRFVRERPLLPVHDPRVEEHWLEGMEHA